MEKMARKGPLEVGHEQGPAHKVSVMEKLQSFWKEARESELNDLRSEDWPAIHSQNANCPECLGPPFLCLLIFLS